MKHIANGRQDVQPTCPCCGAPLETYLGDPYCPDCLRWSLDREPATGWIVFGTDGSDPAA